MALRSQLIVKGGTMIALALAARAAGPSADPDAGPGPTEQPA